MANESPPNPSKPSSEPAKGLPSFRGQPKSMDDLVGRLSSGHHNDGRRPPRPPVAWSQVWLGVVIMLAAVVWFVFALMMGRLFFYPPILFGFGFVAFLKGLLGQRDV